MAEDLDSCFLDTGNGELLFLSRTVDMKFQAEFFHSRDMTVPTVCVKFENLAKPELVRSPILS